jgi:sulfonate transport system ATP-binding protein
VLSIRNLSKHFASGPTALTDVEIDLAPGEIVAFLGGAGSGKSTLLRLIAGLDLPSAGCIRIDGERVTGPHPAVGLILPEPRLLPWLSVARNIAFAIDEWPKPEQERRVREALELIGLGDAGDASPKELSRGQSLAVAAARALVAQPKLLLLDDPFAGLDRDARDAAMAGIAALWTRYRPALALATRDVPFGLAVAHRIVLMDAKTGRIADGLRPSSHRRLDRGPDPAEGVGRAADAAEHCW